jgi:hypothetical protein
MTPEEALKIADNALIAYVGNPLTDIQRMILSESLVGKGYGSMDGYETQHIKNEGSKLWRLLSNALEEKVSKTSFKGALEKRLQSSIVSVPSNPSIPSIQIDLASSKRREWIKLQVLDGFINGKKDSLKLVHTCLHPPLEPNEKDFIIQVLLLESQHSDIENMRFLDAFSLADKRTEYFKSDFNVKGEYTENQGDLLLERVIDSCHNSNPKVREKSTHALRNFGRMGGIPCTSAMLPKLAKAIIALVEDEDLLVKRWGLSALGDQAWVIPEEFYAHARVLLEKNLCHSNAQIRASATWSLGHAKSFYQGKEDKLFGFMLEKLCDKNSGVIDSALIALDTSLLIWADRVIIGDFESFLYQKLVEIGKSAGGHRLDYIGSIVEKMGCSLPENIALRLSLRLSRTRKERERIEMMMCSER